MMIITEEWQIIVFVYSIFLLTCLIMDFIFALPKALRDTGKFIDYCKTPPRKATAWEIFWTLHGFAFILNWKHFLLSVLMIFLTFFIGGLGVEADAWIFESPFLIRLVVPGFLVWLFFLESGLLASNLRGFRFPGIACLVFWVLPILALCLWGGYSLALQKLTREFLATHWNVPLYFVTENPDYSVQIMRYISYSLMAAVLVTLIIAYVLFLKIYKVVIQERL